MKKMFFTAIVLMLCVLLCACGDAETDITNPKDGVQSDSSETSALSMSQQTEPESEDEQSEPSNEAILVGCWITPDGNAGIEFTDDGIVRLYSKTDNGFTQSGTADSYQQTDDRLTLINIDGSDMSMEFTYVCDGDTLTMTLVENNITNTFEKVATLPLA